MLRMILLLTMHTLTQTIAEYKNQTYTLEDTSFRSHLHLSR
jgi:hypothetical protein